MPLCIVMLCVCVCIWVCVCVCSSGVFVQKKARTPKPLNTRTRTRTRTVSLQCRHTVGWLLPCTTGTRIFALMINGCHPVRQSASPPVRHLASGSPVFLSFRSAVLSFRASSKRLGRKAAQNVKLLLARLWHILPPFLPLVSPFPAVLCYPVERPLLQLLQISDDLC